MLLLAQHPQVVALQQIDFFRRLAHLGRWFDTREAYGMRALTTAVAEGIEPEDESRGLSRIPLSNVLSEERYYELVQPLAEDVYNRLADCNTDNHVVVEQTPEYVQVWREILKVFPDAYFIHVVRDPRSVFCSQRNAAKSWADPTRFSCDPVAIAGEWTLDVTRAREIAKATERYLELRYEDMRGTPTESLTRIFEWLDLPCDNASVEDAVAACSIDKMRGSAHAPKGFFRKGEVQGWRREMSRKDVRMLEYIAAGTMRECGYETTTDVDKMPWRLRVRLSKQNIRQGLAHWAAESDGPLKRKTSRALKAFPRIRKFLLRNLKRSA